MADEMNLEKQTKLSREQSINICHYCNNEGKEGGCPRCGLTSRKKILRRTSSVEVGIIPISYHGKLWEKPESTNLREKQFDDTLETVHNLFLKGELPKFSMFISAPAKSGKMLFAYSCMQTAAVQNYTVAPLLTASDWRRVYRASQMNPMYKLYNKYKWDYLVTKDVVFITIDDSEDRHDVISMLKTIYDTRASFDLPTFVISDYNLTSLVSKYTDEYTKIYNSAQDRDYKRYPVIIHRN